MALKGSASAGERGDSASGDRGCGVISYVCAMRFSLLVLILIKAVDCLEISKTV